ncbi:MAG: hypothetical protein C4290_04700 [Chloroflexota bacterium]
MRVALLSDVHANLPALEAVLRHAEEQHALDQVWCLGDLVGYGPHPSECLALLRRYPFVSVAGNHDLAATGDREKVNDTFNVGAKEFTTMKEDYQAVLDHAGFGKKIIPLPAWPMVWALRVLEFYHLSPLYKWVYETAHKDSYVSIEKAERILGFAPKYSNREALLRNFQWYLDNLPKFQNTTGVSHRVPWKQGILGLAKLFF